MDVIWGPLESGGFAIFVGFILKYKSLVNINNLPKSQGKQTLQTEHLPNSKLSSLSFLLYKIVTGIVKMYVLSVSTVLSLTK